MSIFMPIIIKLACENRERVYNTILHFFELGLHNDHNTICKIGLYVYIVFPIKLNLVWYSVNLKQSFTFSFFIIQTTITVSNQRRYLPYVFFLRLRCAGPQIQSWRDIKAHWSKSISLYLLLSFPFSKMSCVSDICYSHGWSGNTAETHTLTPLYRFSPKLNSPWKIVYKLFSCTHLGSEAVESANIFILP